MARLSVVLIIKNESSVLDEALQALDWVDEIVVLDSGSSDNSLEIAKKYTDKVFLDTDWQGYGIQRQRAQAHATGDWVLMIDADERVTADLKHAIEAVLKQDERNYIYAIPRRSYVFGRFIRHGGWYPDYVTRLYPKGKGSYGSERVHEKLYFDDSIQVEKLQGDLLHYTYRDMEHYLVKSAHYATEWARQRQAKGRRGSIFQGIIHGLGCFIRMYLLRAGFLDGKQGFLLALLSAHSTFVKYAALWVQQHDYVQQHRKC